MNFTQHLFICDTVYLLINYEYVSTIISCDVYRYTIIYL